MQWNEKNFKQFLIKKPTCAKSRAKANLAKTEYLVYRKTPNRPIPEYLAAKTDKKWSRHDKN